MIEFPRTLSCVIVVARLLKHLILLLLTVQLAAPAGWCCWGTLRPQSQAVAAQARPCCAARESRGPARQIPARATCCCPKVGLRPALFQEGQMPAGDDVIDSVRFDHPAGLEPVSVREVALIHSAPRCARHVFLCVWTC